MLYSLKENPDQSQISNNNKDILTVSNLSLSYKDGLSYNKVLDEISFSLNADSISAIVGESGSGKSSLLSIIAGLIIPTNGSVTINDTVITDLGEKERTRFRLENIGFIFQNPNLFESLKVIDQLVLSSHIRGMRSKELKSERKKALELLDLVGLADLKDRNVHQLSGGQKQRVNIARALMSKPSLILADEPTSALDSELSATIMGLLIDVTKELHVAAAVVTHDRNLLDSVDSVIELQDGKIVS